MRNVLAIAGLTVKSAVRSRLFVTLVILLLLVVIGLPLTVKGDGTLSGQTALLLYYSLGLVAVILGISTVWVSCWSIAREVEEKHIQTLVVKPVHRSQLWLGKWLGILSMNAVLMVLAGCITYVSVMMITAGSDVDPEEQSIVREEILNCRKRLLPEKDDISEEVHRLMEAMMARGQISKDLPHDLAHAQAYKRLVAAKSTVSPGQSRAWVFNVSHTSEPEARASIRYHLSVHARERNPVTGRWVVGTDSDPEAYSKEIDNYLQGRHRLDLPADILKDTEKLTVTFVNSDRDKSNAAVFHMKKDMELLIDSGNFTGNYLRTFIIIFCHISLLAAIGLTASSLFTFPVASFTVFSILLMSLLTHFFTILSQLDDGQHCAHHHVNEEASWIEQAMAEVVLRLDTVVAPAMNFQPIGPMTDGIMVSWQDTAKAVLILLILYPGLFALLGSLFLNKRELALPV